MRGNRLPHWLAKVAAKREAGPECELIDRRSFRSKAEARLAPFTYIEGWYNPRRPPDARLDCRPCASTTCGTLLRVAFAPSGYQWQTVKSCSATPTIQWLAITRAPTWGGYSSRRT
jgi:hypothetical protein